MLLIKLCLQRMLNGCVLCISKYACCYLRLVCLITSTLDGRGSQRQPEETATEIHHIILCYRITCDGVIIV